MKVLVLLCMGLLMDQAEALRESRQNHTGENGNRRSIHTLDCGEGKHVLIVDVRIYFTGACSCTYSCYHWSTVANFELYLADCENKSRCTVSVQDANQTCDGGNRNAQDASLFYECSSASAVLAMDSSGSTSGRTVAARFSSPDLQSSNSSWQCRVEASDCSNLTSTVELLIRNTRSDSLSFLSTRNVERLGSYGLGRNKTTSVTPFSVTLDLVARSRVHPAYVLVTADTSIIMTCGQRTAIPPASFCEAPTTEPPSQTSVVGPAVGGAVAALVVIAVVVVIIVVVVARRNRTAQKAAGGESGDGESPGRPAGRDNMALNDVTQDGEEQAHDMRDYLHVIPEPKTAAASASTADQPYEPLDQASREDINTASPYQVLGPATTSGDVSTTYEPLDQASRDDDNMAAPYQVLGPATASGDVNTAYEPLDPASRSDVDTVSPYKTLRSATTSDYVNTA